MSVKLRLARGGTKKRPYYRIVAADSAMPRDGRFLEKIGTYNPMVSKDHPDRVKIDTDRAKHWLEHGAIPTDRVERFLAQLGLVGARKIPNQTKKSQPHKNTLERIEAKETKIRERAEALAAAKAEAEAAANAPAPEPEAVPAEEASTEA